MQPPPPPLIIRTLVTQCSKTCLSDARRSAEAEAEAGAGAGC